MTGDMCLAIHPDGGDFPARCIRPPHHVGPHTSASAVGWTGVSWAADEEAA